MSHFSSYNTSESTKTGQVPLQHGETIILQPMQTDRATSITGSVFTDKAGKLFIEQSFDYRATEETNSPATGEQGHWDVSSTFSITASEGKGFSEPILAPWVRIRFENSSSENQTVLRLFARTLVTGSQ